VSLKPVASLQKKTTGRHLPTKANGVYKSVSPRTGKVTWEARYRDSTGKYVYEVSPSFEDAKARRASMANKAHRGELVVNSTDTLADVLPAWSDITRADVRSWLNSMKRKDGREGAINEGTKSLVLSTLSSIMTTP
jgi:hypothetical protein